jgi:hypothetical protein
MKREGEAEGSGWGVGIAGARGQVGGRPEPYGSEILRKHHARVRATFSRPGRWRLPVRVGIRSDVVGMRRIDSAARTAASVVREACASGDQLALHRFWGTFVGELRAPGTASAPTSSAGNPNQPLRPRRPV